MTARSKQRPQLVARGDRAVLIARRDQVDAESPAMARTLDAIAALGYRLVSIVDPSDHRRAHAMVGEGLVDVIVVGRLDQLPSVRITAGNGYTQPVLRPAGAPYEGPASQRRPQPVVAEEPTPPPLAPRDERRTELVDRSGKAPEPVAPPAAVVSEFSDSAPTSRSQRRRLVRRSAA